MPLAKRLSPNYDEDRPNEGQHQSQQPNDRYRSKEQSHCEQEQTPIRVVSPLERLLIERGQRAWLPWRRRLFASLGSPERLVSGGSGWRVKCALPGAMVTFLTSGGTRNCAEDGPHGFW